MPRYKPGDRVTLRRGKKQNTAYTPGEADLSGVQAVVCDNPMQRVGSVDGKVKDRVTVRPVLPSTGDGPRFGLPLDVPVDSLSKEARTGFFEGLGGAADEVVRRVGRGIKVLGGWPDTTSPEWNRPGIHFSDDEE